MGIEFIASAILLIAGIAFAIATGVMSAFDERERERNEGEVA